MTARIERPDMDRVVRERDMTCSGCERFYDISELDVDRKCPACNGTAPTDTTDDAAAPAGPPQPGDPVVVTDSGGGTFRGTLFHVKPHDNQVDYRDAARRHHSYGYNDLYADVDVDTVTFNEVILINETVGGGRTLDLTTLVRDYPDAVDPTMTVRDFVDTYNATRFNRLVGIWKIEHVTPVPPLRPGDGIYLMTHPNEPLRDGEGGLVDRGPDRDDKLLDRVGLVIHKYDDDDDCYEVWAPYCGYRYRVNLRTTKVYRRFRSTSRDWCPDRRRPILAFARWMADSYNEAVEEDRAAGVV